MEMTMEVAVFWDVKLYSLVSLLTSLGNVVPPSLEQKNDLKPHILLKLW
jgi:hypothetical protein